MDWELIGFYCDQIGCSSTAGFRLDGSRLIGSSYKSGSFPLQHSYLFFFSQRVRQPANETLIVSI